MNESTPPASPQARRRPRKLRTSSKVQEVKTETEKPADKGVGSTKQDVIPEPENEVKELEPEDALRASASPRRRQRRRPRKLAMRPVEPIEDDAVSIVPLREEAKVNVHAPVEERVTRLEHRVQEINYRLESTTIDVEHLRSGRQIQRSVPEPILRIEEADEPSIKPSEPSIDDDVDLMEDEESDIEEITRSELPPERPSPQPLALRGSYNVPLPRGISTTDVQAIQRGASAAGSIARTINASFRSSTTTVQETRGQRTNSGSWGGLFSQASRIVTGAMGAIDLNAAVESQGSYKVQHSYSTSTVSSTAKRSATTTDRSRQAESAGRAHTDTASSATKKTPSKKRGGSRRKPASDGSRQKSSAGPS